MDQGTGTTSLDVKRIHKMADMREEVLYDVFIDHRKVSDTLNMEFFFGYPSWLQDRTEDG